MGLIKMLDTVQESCVGVGGGQLERRDGHDSVEPPRL